MNSRSTEVKSEMDKRKEDLAYSTEIVELKDQVFREVLNRPPNDPSDTHRAHTVLVARGIDTISSFSDYSSLFHKFLLTYELEGSGSPTGNEGIQTDFQNC